MRLGGRSCIEKKGAGGPNKAIPDHAQKGATVVVAFAGRAEACSRWALLRLLEGQGVSVDSSNRPAASPLTVVGTGIFTHLPRHADFRASPEREWVAGDRHHRWPAAASRGRGRTWPPWPPRAARRQKGSSGPRRGGGDGRAGHGRPRRRRERGTLCAPGGGCGSGPWGGLGGGPVGVSRAWGGGGPASPGGGLRRYCLYRPYCRSRCSDAVQNQKGPDAACRKRRLASSRSGEKRSAAQRPARSSQHAARMEPSQSEALSMSLCRRRALASCVMQQRARPGTGRKPSTVLGDLLTTGSRWVR